MPLSSELMKGNPHHALSVSISNRLKGPCDQTRGAIIVLAGVDVEDVARHLPVHSLIESTRPALGIVCVIRFD